MIARSKASVLGGGGEVPMSPFSAASLRRDLPSPRPGFSPAPAQGKDAPKPAQPPIRGRVLDETGRPVAGARVRLYRRDSR